MANINKISVKGVEYNIEDSSKQPMLISGTNIKTINDIPLLGFGNIQLKTVNYNSVVGTGNISIPIFNGGTVSNEIYYDDGSGQLVPVKHPDLSTQPSILPYKFMGQYVYERLIPSADMLLSSMVEIPFSILPENSMILDCACIYENGFSPTDNIFKFKEGDNFNWAFRMPLSDIDHLGNLLYIKVVYTSMPEEGGDYYSYNNY